MLKLREEVHHISLYWYSAWGKICILWYWPKFLESIKGLWLLFFLSWLSNDHAVKWKMVSSRKSLLTVSFVCGLEDALRFNHGLCVLQEILSMWSGWKRERQCSSKTIQLMWPHGKMTYNEQSFEFIGFCFNQGTKHILCLLVKKKKKKGNCLEGNLPHPEIKFTWNMVITRLFTFYSH